MKCQHGQNVCLSALCQFTKDFHNPPPPHDGQLLLHRQHTSSSQCQCCGWRETYSLCLNLSIINLCTNLYVGSYLLPYCMQVISDQWEQPSCSHSNQLQMHSFNESGNSNSQLHFLRKYSFTHHRRRNQEGTGGSYPPKFSVCATSTLYVLYYKLKTVPLVFHTPLHIGVVGHSFSLTHGICKTTLQSQRDYTTC